MRVSLFSDISHVMSKREIGKAPTKIKMCMYSTLLGPKMTSYAYLL